MTAALGQTVVVENRVGASGIIGYDYGLKAPPDGHTVTAVSTTYSIIPSLYKLPYDPIKDMQPSSISKARLAQRGRLAPAK